MTVYFMNIICRVYTLHNKKSSFAAPMYQQHRFKTSILRIEKCFQPCSDHRARPMVVIGQFRVTCVALAFLDVQYCNMLAVVCPVLAALPILRVALAGLFILYTCFKLHCLENSVTSLGCFYRIYRGEVTFG